MNILAKYKDGYYYKAKIVKIYSKYTCYIKWEDNTSNDRIKSIKDIIVIPKEKYGYRLYTVIFIVVGRRSLRKFIDNTFNICIVLFIIFSKI